MGEQIGDGFVDSPFLFSSSRHSYSPVPTLKNYCKNNLETELWEPTTNIDETHFWEKRD